MGTKENENRASLASDKVSGSCAGDFPINLYHPEWREAGVSGVSEGVSLAWRGWKWLNYAGVSLAAKSFSCISGEMLRISFEFFSLVRTYDSVPW